MRKMSEIKGRLTNLLERKDFLQELNNSPALKEHYNQPDNSGISNMSQLRLDILDPDEKVCSFDNFIRRKRP